MRDVVVTGGAGFIGSNIAERLVGMGRSVTIIDDLSSGSKTNIDDLVSSGDVELVVGSINDRPLLRKCFEGARSVLHQAALPSVARSVKDPLTTNEVNVGGTLNVLVAARDAGVKKVVMASSSSVYGDTPTLPKREAMAPTPKSPYAVSKLTAEQYGRVFSEVYGLPTVCLRYFNVYGPRQDPRSEYAAVIPRFMTLALRNEPPVIYGDGTQTRDFTFVQDVVTANIQAMESEAQGVFNIAGGRQVSIADLARRIIGMCGADAEPMMAEARAGDILHSWADISAARDAFGYRPVHTLENGLEVTLSWFKRAER